MIDRARQHIKIIIGEKNCSTDYCEAEPKYLNTKTKMFRCIKCSKQEHNLQSQCLDLTTLEFIIRRPIQEVYQIKQQALKDIYKLVQTINTKLQLIQEDLELQCSRQYQQMLHSYINSSLLKKDLIQIYNLSLEWGVKKGKLIKQSRQHSKIIIERLQLNQMVNVLQSQKKNIDEIRTQPILPEKRPSLKHPTYEFRTQPKVQKCLHVQIQKFSQISLGEALLAAQQRPQQESFMQKLDDLIFNLKRPQNSKLLEYLYSNVKTSYMQSNYQPSYAI